MVFQEDACGRTPLHLVCKMYKNKEFELLLRDTIMGINPSFFDSFDPSKRLEIDQNVIKCNLSKDDQFNVLEGDVSLEGIAKKIKAGKIKNVIVMAGIYFIFTIFTFLTFFDFIFNYF